LKRLGSILLLGMLLFNWVGYRLFTAYMENKADSRLEVRLDMNGFDESRLISIKVPATYLSSYTLSNTFERVDGQVDIHGTRYKYVKRRVFNDSLELLCIPDQEVINLQTAKDNFFSLVNDLQHNGHEKQAGSHGASAKVFLIIAYPVNDPFKMNERYFTVSKKIFHYLTTPSFSYSFTAEHPPDCLA
jgi:hypothetical protein